MEMRYPMKKNGSTQAKERVLKKTVRKMLNIPFWAYWVQISTTRLLSFTDAFSTPSSLMLALMNSTARYARVATACIEAPENQKMTAPPAIKPSRKGAWMSESLSTLEVRLLVRIMMIEKIIVVAPT